MTEPNDPDALEDRLKGYLQRFDDYPRGSASTLDTASTATMPAAPRRARLGLMAVVAALALCLAGTATALTISLRRSATGAPPRVASLNGSAGRFFIPVAGTSGATGSGGAGADPALQGRFGLAIDAPAPHGASSGQGTAGGIIFPGYACGAGAPQVSNGQVEVQGVAALTTADQTSYQQLTITVAGTGTGNAAEVSDAQAREAAIDNALQKAGVNVNDITVRPVQVGQYYQKAPGQSPTPGAVGFVDVRSSDPVELGTAADVAQRTGGTQVNNYGGFGTAFSTPTAADISGALSAATATAHDEAVAAASASGVHLGRVSGIVASPPSLCYGAQGQQLVIAVTITYSASS